MDIEKLDMLLDELRLADSNAKSVDFNEFCNNNWGQNGQTFAICDQIVRTLIADGHAEHPEVDKHRIRLTNSGRQFKGYAKTEIDNKASLDSDNELKQLTIENLKYQTTIRDKELEIRQLTANNLKLQNKHFKRYVIYAVVVSLITLLADNLSEVGSFLQSIFQK
jgi:hypothetical protein